MIICSNCKHSNMAGAMFCTECGAQLAGQGYPYHSKYLNTAIR